MVSTVRRGSTHMSAGKTVLPTPRSEQQQQQRVTQSGTWTPKGMAARAVYACCSDAGSSIDGKRKVNQDASITDVPHEFGPSAFFGVFDGHGVHDPFHKLDSLHASDVHQINDRFHAMPITQKEAKASQTAAADDWTVPMQQTAQQSQDADATSLPDLGEESEAEALADPMPQPKQAKGPGIWIEPGSNKGYDSYALDSLQGHGVA